MELSLIQIIAVWILPVLFAITLHEVAHGWVAHLLGDDTAANLGRLSFNPIRHIDPIGTILVPAILLAFGGFIFGWAKPVPVEWRNLKHPRRDMALVAFAGPLMNLIQAIIWAFVAKLGSFLVSTYGKSYVAILYMGKAGIVINIALLVLNLLPIPPLDGSRVVAAMLPSRLAAYYDKIEPYGLLILLVLLASGVLGQLILPFFLIVKKLITGMI